jgi:DNA polymerase III delta subunit
MITLLTGENTFQIEQEIAQIVDNFDGNAERIDGSELELKQLPDLLTGSTLFADKRLVVIKNLSENKAVWTDLVDWLPRVSDDIDLVLVDTKPDKRTVTYKELKKIAKVIECNPWTDRDGAKAIEWGSEQAKKMEINLNTKSVQLIVQRVGVDQWNLLHALEKLALAGEITDEVIESVIDANPTENVFNLFDAALRGDRRKIAQMLRTLELTEEPYRLFALLSGQAFQLAALAVSDSSDNVAKDLGVNPYAISKLASTAKKLGRNGARKVVAAFAEADDDMKLSRGEPWLLIERALMQLSLK